MSSIMSSIISKIARFFKIAHLVAVQTIQRNILSIRRSRLFSPTTQPDAWKVIAQRTDLYPSRVFRPKLSGDKVAASPLPLVIMVHGGGWMMNNPSVDDPLARFLADSCDCLVISIDYRKLPRNPFPASYEDVLSSILSLVNGKDNDSDLRFDASRVVLFGSSAGANLALAAAQDSLLRGRLAGIIGLYPVVNVAVNAKEQLERRPDPSIPDFLDEKWDGIVPLYMGTTDLEARRDRRASPTYFEGRESLPDNMFLVGCEHDMVCHEAMVMAEKLAEEAGQKKESTADGWQAGNVRWKLVKGQLHAFDLFPNKFIEEEARLREKDALFQDFAKWLKDVFAKA